ncbi:DUF4012 domain-containing protein [Patescibacteria group bacterium]
MAKAKTKKSTRSKKATKKKKAVVRKKSTNKSVKKTAKSLNRSTNKIVKAKTTLIFHSVKIISKKPQKSTLIRKGNSRPSPYILDLKKIQDEKTNADHKEQHFAQAVSQDLINKFAKQKTELKTNVKNSYLNMKSNLGQVPKNISHKIKTKPNTVKTAFQKLIPKQKPQAVKAAKRPRLKISIPQIKFPKLQPQEINMGFFTIPATWKKSIIGFVIISLVVVLPFASYSYYLDLEGKKNLVLSKAADALWHLAISQKAASAQNFYYTQLELEEAANNFGQAQNELNDINIIVESLIKITPHINDQYLAAEKIIDIGKKLTETAAILTSTIDALQLNNINGLESLNLTEKLTKLTESLNQVAPMINQANTDLQEIDTNTIPQEYQAQFKKIQAALPILEQNIDNFLSYSDLFLTILGHDIKKRYLFIFQNNNEIRPTGGFMGSYALVDIDQGNIEKIDIPGGGPYDLKAGLRASIAAPKPLRLINPRWEFQDTNWFADFPTSAEKMMWFYEKSGGPTVDGLFLINASFLEKILAITGPIELPQYGKIITSENFYNSVQQSVELNYNKEENKPKQIIADLTPLLIDRLLNTDKKELVDLLDLLLKSLEQKEIQLYFSNYNLEKLILKYNWGGQIKNTDRDYLSIISTNIAGEKTDAKINQLASLQVEVAADGSIINTLAISKTHTGQKGETFYGVPNLDYLRVYVPEGSEFISAEGFDVLEPELFSLLDPEIYQPDPDIALIEANKKFDPNSHTEIFNELNKTVFANWFKVEPGKTKTAIIKYKPPFRLNLDKATNLSYFEIIKNELDLNQEDKNNLEKYSLLWQKQSGKNNFKINLQVNMANGLDYKFTYPNQLFEKNDIFTYSADLLTDQLFAIIFRQN